MCFLPKKHTGLELHIFKRLRTLTRWVCARRMLSRRVFLWERRLPQKSSYVSAGLSEHPSAQSPRSHPKSRWPHAVALSMSACEWHTFSAEFRIPVAGDVREAPGREPGKTRSAVPMPALHFVSAAKRAATPRAGRRCAGDRAVDAGPVRASPPRLGED